jgi:hypothetical protein
MSTAVQIKIIHTLRGQIPGLAEDDVYRDFLESVAGKRSSKDLTEDQARQVMRALEQLRGGKVVQVKKSDDPKAPLIGRILREAYSAGWDRPEQAGAFDSSDAARRQRTRDRVMAWLKTHHPHLHGSPKRLEAWPVEALQHLMEHLKGVVGAQRRWKR